MMLQFIKNIIILPSPSKGFRDNQTMQEKEKNRGQSHAQNFNRLVCRLTYQNKTEANVVWCTIYFLLFWKFFWETCLKVRFHHITQIDAIFIFFLFWKLFWEMCHKVWFHHITRTSLCSGAKPEGCLFCQSCIGLGPYPFLTCHSVGR